MDESKVKEWVEANIKPLCEEFGIPHWGVKVHFVSMGDEFCGDCSAYPLYERATIRLDPAGMDDEAYLKKVFEHELLHIVNAPWDGFWDLVTKAIPEGSVDLVDTLREAHHQAKEISNIGLERLVRGVRGVK